MFLLLSGMIFSMIASGQKTELSSFSGNQIGQAVYLSFTIRGGNTCTGTGIERSPDNVNFTGIGEIPGICGSSSSDQTYSFTDNNPVPNTKNYYRIELGLRSGLYSAFISVSYVDYGAYGHLVFPNPAADKTVIYFPNSKKELFDFTIYNQQGKITRQISCKETFIEIDANEFSAGVYLYHLLQKNDIKYSGRIVFR